MVPRHTSLIRSVTLLVCQIAHISKQYSNLNTFTLDKKLVCRGTTLFQSTHHLPSTINNNGPFTLTKLRIANFRKFLTFHSHRRELRFYCWYNTFFEVRRSSEFFIRRVWNANENLWNTTKILPVRTEKHENCIFLRLQYLFLIF